jgi:cytochrome oxidase Cu insertion factor (SCO1/SenC/PrrC family)
MMKRNPLLLVLSLAIMLLLQACGGGGDGDDVEGINVGAKAPDFTLPSATGEEVSLDDYDNQPVLLYFHMAMG